MRRWRALGLLVTFSWSGGRAQDARAGVTIDVLFQDGTGHALTIAAGDAGPGCTFNGYYGSTVASGRCMDLVMTSTVPFLAFIASVTYDSDNGLAVGNAYEWKGVGVAFNDSGVATKYCAPGTDPDIEDDGTMLSRFDCLIPMPSNPPEASPGTYRIGTIVWDTSGTNPGQETIAAYIWDVIDGVVAVIDGNVVVLTSADIVVNSALLRIIPEPSTAALLGLGLVSLVLATRRRTPPTR